MHWKMYLVFQRRLDAFNTVVRLIVSNFYDEYVKLPVSKEEQKSEVRGFIENYGFHLLVRGIVFMFISTQN